MVRGAWCVVHGAWRVVRGAWCVGVSKERGVAHAHTHTHTHEWHLAHATVQCAWSVWRAMAGNEAHASRRDPIDQLDRALDSRDAAHATQLGGPGVGAPLCELLRRQPRALLALRLEVSGAWLLKRRRGRVWRPERDPRSEAYPLGSRGQPRASKWADGAVGGRMSDQGALLTGLLRRAACRSCAARQRRWSWPPARRRGGGGREGPLA